MRRRDRQAESDRLRLGGEERIEEMHLDLGQRPGPSSATDRHSPSRGLGRRSAPSGLITWGALVVRLWRIWTWADGAIPKCGSSGTSRGSMRSS